MIDRATMILPVLLHLQINILNFANQTDHCFIMELQIRLSWWCHYLRWLNQVSHCRCGGAVFGCVGPFFGRCLILRQGATRQELCRCQPLKMPIISSRHLVWQPGYAWRNERLAVGSSCSFHWNRCWSYDRVTQISHFPHILASGLMNKLKLCWRARNGATLAGRVDFEIWLGLSSEPGMWDFILYLTI